MTWPMNLTVEERREAMAQVAEHNPERFGKDSAAWFRGACLEEHDPGYLCLQEKGHPGMNPEALKKELRKEPPGELGSYGWVKRYVANGNDAADCIDTLQQRLREVEEAVLRKSGWFPWGHDAWIHESDQGWVRTREEAVRQALTSNNTEEGE